MTALVATVERVDEWGHRHLSGRWHRRLFGWLCDWRERYYGAE